MATQVQIRRGTAAQHASFVGAPSEITHDTTNNVLVVHDGVTPGGHKPPSPADFAASLALKQNLSEKGQPLGYASLGADGKVPTAQLPADFGGSAEVIKPTNVLPADAATDIPGIPAFLEVHSTVSTAKPTQLRSSRLAKALSLAHRSTIAGTEQRRLPRLSHRVR